MLLCNNICGVTTFKKQKNMFISVVLSENLVYIGSSPDNSNKIFLQGWTDLNVLMTSNLIFKCETEYEIALCYTVTLHFK